MRHFVLMAFICLASFSLAACITASAKYKYKAVVTVSTPEGDKTGASVREASMYTERSILPDQGVGRYNIVKGEAVVVDLGARGVLFFLLGEREAFIAFNDTSADSGKPRTDGVFNRYRDLKIASFKDRADPQTKFSADWSDLEKDFGAGVFLKSVVFERTREPATLGVVNQWLPWISGKEDVMGLSYADFQKGAR